MPDAGRKGAQELRISVNRGNVAYTDGEDAALLMHSLGIDLFPWERNELNALCARDEADAPSFVSYGLAVPRQNGKNLILEAFELYQLSVCGAHILHTAHRVKTAKKAFRRLEKYFTDKRHPELMRLVVRIRRTNGEEAIELSNGGSIEFSARSRAEARGFDNVQIVVFDEAQDLTDDQLNAVMFTLSASSTGYRQLVYTGTPPDKNSPGTVFYRIRKNTVEKSDMRRCHWSEWSVEEKPPENATFADVIEDVYACNPSIGYVLDIEFTQDEFAESDIEGFAVERLGWWASTESTFEHVIEEGEWRACSVGEPPQEGKRAFGVKFSVDGTSSAISICIKPDEGAPFVELVDVLPMPAGLNDLVRTVEGASNIAVTYIDGQSYASLFADELIKAGVSKRAVVISSYKTMADADSMFEAAVKNRQVQHIATDYEDALTQSVTGTTRRRIGKRGSWGFGDAEFQAYPAESAALALFAAATTKRDPEGGLSLW